MSRRPWRGEFLLCSGGLLATVTRECPDYPATKTKRRRPQAFPARVRMSEQRIHPRVDVKIEVQYQPVQDFQTAQSMNISIGGIYVCTPQPLPRDHRLLLRIPLPGVAEPLSISGVVVWSNPGTSRSPFPPGMGIKFLDVVETEAKLLADFVARAQSQVSASPPAEAPAPPPPAPVSVTASSLGIQVLSVPAKPAQATSPPPAAKAPVFAPPAAPTVEPPQPARPAVPPPPPPSAPEPMIPEHIRRQMEHMLSLQAQPTAPEPTRPAPPASGPGKPAAPPPTGKPGQPNQQTRTPLKPEDKKKT